MLLCTSETNTNRNECACTIHKLKWGVRWYDHLLRFTYIIYCCMVRSFFFFILIQSIFFLTSNTVHTAWHLHFKWNIFTCDLHNWNEKWVVAESNTQQLSDMKILLFSNSILSKIVLKWFLIVIAYYVISAASIQC